VQTPGLTIAYPSTPVSEQSRVGGALLVAGGVFVLYYSLLGASIAGACFPHLNGGCSTWLGLTGLYAATGWASVGFGILYLVRPRTGRAGAAIVCALSMISMLAVGEVFAHIIPASRLLAFLVILLIWPFFLSLTGGILALLAPRPHPLLPFPFPVPGPYAAEPHPPPPLPPAP
jgi:hypothetical protein